MNLLEAVEETALALKLLILGSWTQSQVENISILTDMARTLILPAKPLTPSQGGQYLDRIQCGTYLQNDRTDENMPKLESGHKSVLQVLEHAQLSAVTFVQDYVQLHFDGPCLTAYVWPKITSRGRDFNSGSPGYRDALCELIGANVVATFEEPACCLGVQFFGGEKIEISLKEADREGPEAAAFREDAGGSLSIW